VQVLVGSLGDGDGETRAGAIGDGAENGTFVLEGTAGGKVELDHEGTDHRSSMPDPLLGTGPLPSTLPFAPGARSPPSSAWR
jgi:hypothetical protein